MDISADIGQRVRHLRRARGMTQLRLAYEARLSVEIVGRVERGCGSPTIRTVGRLAEGLGVPVTCLLDPHVAARQEKGQPEPLVEMVGYLQQKSPEDVSYALTMVRQILDR